MIKFFRKIRQRLLSENKFSKYLLYAIGEIILVVIGILIALQVNNKNEQRTKDQEADKLLVQIQDDLLDAISSMEIQRKRYIKKDSIYKIIVSDTLKMADMLKPENYKIHRFTYDFHPYIIQKEGYTSFINKVDQFSEKYTNLEPELKNLYLDFAFYYETTQNEIKKVVERQYAYARDFVWYKNVWSGQNLTAEFAEYLLHDHKYKNEALTYQTFMWSLVGVTTRFQKEAVDLYLRIYDITQYPKELPEAVSGYYDHKSEDFVNSVIGTYRPQDSTSTSNFVIKYKDGQLYFNDLEAYFKNDNEIIVLKDFPNANIFRYDANTKSLTYSLLYESTKKRVKIDD